jgi:deoxyribonuclease-4
MGLLGSHVSTSGGIEHSPALGREIGCLAMQIFTANQMRWQAKPLTTQSCQKFQTEMTRLGIIQAVSHGSYLVNLGSPKEDTLAKSCQNMLEEIDRCEALNISGIIFHPGSHLKEGEERGMARIAASLDAICAARPASPVRLLLETTAGQGTNLGYRFEQLRHMIDLCHYPDRLGICLDTCHIFAAGYDIRTEAGWQRTMAEFDQIIGLDRLKVFHLNDSLKGLGSRIDRHAKIGQGLLTLETFWCLVNDERFQTTPMLLETPVDEDLEYRAEITLLQGLIGQGKP